jgi:cilia- and flagella-associated protein 57
MQRMSEAATEKLLNRFKDELKKVQDEYDKSKRKADGIKMQYEEKINQQNDDDLGEIDRLKEMNDEEIKELNEVISTIKENIETVKMQASREESEKGQYEEAVLRAIRKKEERRKQLQLKKEETGQLTRQKNEIQQNLKDKVKQLFNLKFTIKKLELTKQVLTHRTQEMKASLEPKEQQIESLKDKLLQLEHCFVNQKAVIKRMDNDLKEKTGYADPETRKKHDGKIEKMERYMQEEKNRTR